MRLEHHLVGGYVRYISPHIIIIINTTSRWSLNGLGVVSVQDLRLCMVELSGWFAIIRSEIVVALIWPLHQRLLGAFQSVCEKNSQSSWAGFEPTTFC